MSSACDGNAPRDEMALQRLLAEFAKKGRLQRFSGGDLRRSLTRLPRVQRHDCIHHQSIATACLRSCIPRKAGAPRTQASVPRPIPARRNVANRHGRCDGRGSVGCAGLSQGQHSLSAQRRANKQRSNASARTSVGNHVHPIRLVNEAAGGGIGWFWHPLFAPRRRTFFEPDQVFD
jgi:hypothetical protein